MQYISKYTSPIGSIVLAANETALTGLWFEGQKYFAHSLGTDYIEKELPIFAKAKKWLDIYFSGKEPDFTLPLHLEGTAFQIDVWNILASIPYGQTITYGEIEKSVYLISVNYKKRWCHKIIKPVITWCPLNMSAYLF